ncbi:hypothetical protein Calkr_2029 [Caldicellulosiruptor acetigenus I77R1B]|uniref:Uncharacterized protein n=1 Tax=Caldicellulosiruptor acetigenus (strain ATCC 700853 / DSM 12137 / I77R1B) TaxID=632335 RepID=E4S567_CALA7|nr:hypothetical protein [Caldicellulosiruptor acetigenus]ADQ41501.1 hypothetical protein Calkr_2029 [Caldicellulosiruptor acetigenus I77R1B]
MYAIQAYCGSSNKNSLLSIGASSLGVNKQGQIMAYGEASINIGKAEINKPNTLTLNSKSAQAGVSLKAVELSAHGSVGFFNSNTNISFGKAEIGGTASFSKGINIGGKAMVSAIEIKQSFGFSIGGITVEVGGKGYAGAWGAEGKLKFSSSGISIGGGLAAKVGAGVFINIRW